MEIPSASPREAQSLGAQCEGVRVSRKGLTIAFGIVASVLHPGSAAESLVRAHRHAIVGSGLGNGILEVNAVAG